MTMTGQGNGRTLFKRSGMVAAFGDVGWRLEVGEYGVAPFDARTSPYGWHIIKRLK
jgi:parvulin-like peptidyl-prolyl isomerase